MKEKISFEENDLIKVYQLHSKLEKKHLLFLAFMFLCVVVYSFLMKDKPIILISCALFGGVGGWASYHYGFLRFKAKKIYKQQKGLHNDFEYEITDESLNVSSDQGNSKTPWGDFYRTKEDNEYLLLYFSDALFLTFPKHRLKNEFMVKLKEKLSS